MYMLYTLKFQNETTGMYCAGGKIKLPELYVMISTDIVIVGTISIIIFRRNFL